jgi:polysaccharide biosynthesis transport protein
MNSYELDMPVPDTEGAGGGMGATFVQLPNLLWQRRRIILITTLIGALAALAAILLLPRKYESSATLLVQAPSLPADIIGNQADEAIAQRIEAIRQQIINRPSMIELIQRNNLYSDERQSQPLSEVIEEMRDSITLEPRTVELGPGGGQSRTISVELAFVYKEPRGAQAVTQQLMEQLIETDSTTSAQSLTETVQFLSEQQADLQEKIAAAEGQVAAFNRQYGAVISGGSAMVMGGGGAGYDVQIANLQRDISLLEAQRQSLGTAENRDPVLVNAENRLAAVRSVYAEDHPDVKAAKQQLELAREIARNNINRLPLENIDRQISIARGQIAQLQAAKGREMAQTSAAIALKAQAPAVQQEAQQLQQRVQTLYKQFEDISNRLLAARASAQAGEEQMGQRLMVVDPPVVPDRPISPNRPLIAAGGVLGGVLLGLLLALGLEALVRPIRDPTVLASITGHRPLAMVPVIGAAPRPSKRRAHRRGSKRGGRKGWRLPRRRSAVELQDSED